jgi:hypothetical protein
MICLRRDSKSVQQLKPGTGSPSGTGVRVEIWNIGLAKVLSADVLRELNHSEENIKPFYNHLEDKMQQLQDEIARGKPLRPEPAAGEESCGYATFSESFL